MGTRFSMKGSYIPKEHGNQGYGNESPGVGKYYANSEPSEKNRCGPKMGTGPKCPVSNFQLPILSPGPVYGNSQYKSISQKVKGRSVWVVSKIA